MGEPRWLDEREARAWRGYRRMTDLLALQIARDLACDAGLSDADYTVLAVLSESPERRLRQIELADRMLWSKSRLSHHLDRMEQRGLVKREQHAGNERAIDAVLTTHGGTVIEQAAPAHVASIRRHFIDLLTDDQIDALGDVTETVVQHLCALLDEERKPRRAGDDIDPPNAARLSLENFISERSA